MTTKRKPPAETTTDPTPEEWLAEIGTNPGAVRVGSAYEFTNLTVTDADAEIAEQRRRRQLAHELLLALRDVRRHAIGTQGAAATAWGRPQSQVSRLEADPSVAKVGTFLDYLSAINVDMTIRLSTGNHTLELRSVDGHLVAVNQ